MLEYSPSIRSIYRRLVILQFLNVFHYIRDEAVSVKMRAENGVRLDVWENLTKNQHVC